MPLEMEDEKSDPKSTGQYQYYFYPDSENEDINAAASGEQKPALHQFPKFSPRLYFLVLIPPYEFNFFPQYI